MPATVDDTVVEKFTKFQMEIAFDAVSDPNDWRAPINATVAVSELPLAILAVEFFTATKVEIRQILPDGKVMIFAKGYRAGPAGP